MALSEKEQKLLDQMEAALAAEDPRLASALSDRGRGWYQRRLVVAVVIFAIGVAVLVVGMDLHPLVSVLGFVVMLVATVVALASWQSGGGVAQHLSGEGSPPSQGDVLGHDERWRHRDDDLT